MLERVICLVTGYLLGSIIQAGYWYGRFKHIDIRKYGSGNAGTTNVMRTLGKKAGMTTYLFDALKPIMCMAIIHFVFGNKNGNELLLMMYGGLGVVLGHFTLILREERELLRHRELYSDFYFILHTAGHLLYLEH